MKNNKKMNNDFLSKTDPQGSYTGSTPENEKPIQDADDL